MVATEIASTNDLVSPIKRIMKTSITNNRVYNLPTNKLCNRDVQLTPLTLVSQRKHSVRTKSYFKRCARNCGGVVYESGSMKVVQWKQLKVRRYIHKYEEGNFS